MRLTIPKINSLVHDVCPELAAMIMLLNVPQKEEMEGMEPYLCILNKQELSRFTNIVSCLPLSHVPVTELLQQHLGVGILQ